MAFQNATTCPVCNSAVAPDALFCTNCGSRLPEPPATITQEAQTLPEAAGKSSDVARCSKCNANLEPEAMFCTNCGTRVSVTGVSAPEVTMFEKKAAVSQPEATQPAVNANTASGSEAAGARAETSSRPTASSEANSSPVQASANNSLPFARVPANQTAAAAAMQPVSSTQSATPVPSSQRTDASTKLGQSSSARKGGVFVAVGLVLIVAVAAAMLWMRSAAPVSRHVIILTPQPSSLAVEPNASVQLSVSVQGDGGAGLSWKIAESYGGTVQPAGVTLHGSQFLYHATYNSGGTPGDYHVVATSAANRDSSVTILVHVER